VTVLEVPKTPVVAKLYCQRRRAGCGVKEFTVECSRVLPSGFSTRSGIQREDKSGLAGGHRLNGFRLAQKGGDGA